jgi:hypothetical protein
VSAGTGARPASLPAVERGQDRREQREAERDPERPREQPDQREHDAARDERPDEPAERSVEHGGADGQPDHRERQQPLERRDRPGRPLRLGRRQRLAVDRAQHGVDSRLDPAREVARPEPGYDPLVDDAVGERVGERAFQPVADLDPQRAIILRDEQQGAVVDPLAPELPRAGHADPVLLDRLRLRRGHDEHRDLRALALLEDLELRLERRTRPRSERPGQVGDPRRERRDGLSRLGPRARRRADYCERDERAQ